MNYIKNLKEYIELDREIRKNKEESDFDVFCENHCKDIEELIKEVEKLKI